MPEVVIKYKKPETLKILKGLAKYFDFTLSTKKKTVEVKEDTNILDDDNLEKILIPGDSSIDITDLKAIFSGRNIDAKQLRKDAWERKK